MKITKRQLSRIIKEEKRKILKEQYLDNFETGTYLIDFARAYAGLGAAVQSQVDAVAGAYFNGGGLDSNRFKEVVYEQNPNAINTAYYKLENSLSALEPDDEAGGILEALVGAMELFSQGDQEVEADARAAGDR